MESETSSKNNFLSDFKPQIELPDPDITEKAYLKLRHLFNISGAGGTTCPFCYENSMIYDNTLSCPNYFCPECGVGGDRVSLLDVVMKTEYQKLQELEIIKKLLSGRDKKEGIVRLSEFLMNEDKYITLSGDEICYVFTETTGIYNSHGESFIKKKIKDLIEELDSNHLVNEVIGHIKRKTMIEEIEVHKPYNLLVLKNGIIDTKKYNEIKLLPFDSKYLITKKSNSIFDPKIDYKQSLFYKVLERNYRLNPENIKIVQKIYGYTLLGKQKYKKIFFFIGYRDSGKSVIMMCLADLLGDECISISLQELLNPNNIFIKQQLEGMRANIYPDIPSGIIDTNNLKGLVGEDQHTVQVKYSNTPKKIESSTVQVIGGNETPKIKDISDAVIGKIIFVEHIETIPPNERDPNLLEKLKTSNEKSAILNFALEGLKLLEEDGGFNSTNQDETTKINETRQTMIRKHDSLYSFFDECIDREGLSRISKDTFYQTYKKYCDSYHLTCDSEYNVGRRLLNRKDQLYTEDQRSSYDKKRVYCWVNIRFKDIRPQGDFKKLNDYFDFDKYEEEVKNTPIKDETKEFRDSVLFKVLTTSNRVVKDTPEVNVVFSDSGLTSGVSQSSLDKFVEVKNE